VFILAKKFGITCKITVDKVGKTCYPLSSPGKDSVFNKAQRDSGIVIYKTV